MRQRVLFAGGATGGHLYPALALAAALRARGGIEPVFLTEGGEITERILEPEAVVRLRSEPWTGRRPLRAAASARRLGRLLRTERIAAVVALGGRPGIVPGMWARWTRRPLFLLEQNRVLGRANRVLLPLATRIFLSFEDTEPADRLHDRSLRLGCPVRGSFRPLPFPDPGDPPRLLVLGGSQGAGDLNDLAPAALAAARTGREWRVVHISGPGKEKGIEARYRESGLLASVRPFLQDPAEAFGDAHLVIARAGGSTVAELTAVGRGSLLLPYPHHRDRQQFRNAAALVEGGAAEEIPLDPARVAERIDALRAEGASSALRAMGDAARALGRPDAAERIADVIATHLDGDPSRRRDVRGVDATPRAVGDASADPVSVGSPSTAVGAAPSGSGPSGAASSGAASSGMGPRGEGKGER